ncbi:AI-2E family transporter [Irregularibacter muris]|uniref:AI-2E family transporter n=1 Tax=Irregularibacter muris TaxID=1796619 RepID=A0AAE3KZ10_9FIRM|nr:AI-2E family transporter [Irregularibacter muris]MCR1898530.1 AI-2E family transporter [Irregularibacter muris]
MNKPEEYPKGKNNDRDSLFKEIKNVFFTYFKGKLTIALILGALAWGMLWILKIPYSGIMGVLIGGLNLIPYIGPLLSAILVVGTTLILTNLKKALWALAVVILLQIMDDWILQPKILGKAFGINPIMIFVLVFVGGLAFGIPGMILAVPIGAILKIIFKKYKRNL